jgi:zinc-finger of transposase IS204/IS1001/IS1096/IS1165
MKTSITWSPGAGFVGVERRERAWTVTVDSRQPTFCPGCGAQSKSRHSTYWRTLWDLSAQGAPVVVNARLGRWRCRNQLCDRRIFTERVPSLAAPFARRTARLAGIVRLLGHGAGGRPSERLMRRLGMPVSDTTILAGLRKHARARSERAPWPPSMWLASMTGRGGRAPTTGRSSLTWSVVRWWTCWWIVRRRPRPVGSRSHGEVDSDQRFGRVRSQTPTLETPMPIVADRPGAPPAIQTNLAAIFISLD